MIGMVLAVNEDIVDVRDDVLHTLHDEVYEPGEACRTSHEAERHHLPVILAQTWHGECSVLSVLRVELQLPKPASKIKTKKGFGICSANFFNALVYCAYAVSIWHGFVIERAVV